jgi:hypothetical protein
MRVSNAARTWAALRVNANDCAPTKSRSNMWLKSEVSKDESKPHPIYSVVRHRPWCLRGMIFEKSSLASDTEMADRDPSPQKARLRDFGSRLTPAKRLKLSVILPRGLHPFPSRTRKLSPAGPIVLHAKVCGRVGRCRH